MMTDPATHHDTPSTLIDLSGQGNYCDNVLHTNATHATDYPHSLIGNRIHQRIAHHANIVISNDDTFLSNIVAHFNVNQSG